MSNFQTQKHISRIDFLGISFEIPLLHMNATRSHMISPQWFRWWLANQATGHYLSQCWPRSMMMETFSALLASMREIHRSPVNSPHKGQWRGALMFSLICAWINGWVNNRGVGDLRRHRSHYDVIVMLCCHMAPKWVMLTEAPDCGKSVLFVMDQFHTF